VNFVTSLHVAAAVFLLGPLVFAASATPRALRAGAEGLGTLRFLAKTTQIYGYLSLLVVILGLANVRDDITFSQTWVWLSLILSVAAIGTFVLLVAPAQQAAVRDLETGHDAKRRLPLIAASSGLAAAALLAVVFLMIYKPGLG